MLCVNSRHARSQIGRDVFEMNLWDKPGTHQATAILFQRMGPVFIHCGLRTDGDGCDMSGHGRKIVTKCFQLR